MPLKFTYPTLGGNAPFFQSSRRPLQCVKDGVKCVLRTQVQSRRRRTNKPDASQINAPPQRHQSRLPTRTQEECLEHNNIANHVDACCFLPLNSGKCSSLEMCKSALTRMAVFAMLLGDVHHVPLIVCGALAVFNDRACTLLYCRRASNPTRDVKSPSASPGRRLFL